MNVKNVSPSVGALSGGLEVNITGAGFGFEIDDVNVTLGNSSCKVILVNSSNLTCTTTEHVEGVVDLTVGLLLLFSSLLNILNEKKSYSINVFIIIFVIDLCY